MNDSLWAITSYFNPMRYRRRKSNYLCFREHLGVPLVAVELGYDDQFDLEAKDADVLIRVPGRDVLWQKERLLNIALGALPGACTQVAWLDADIVMGDDRWFERVDDALSKFTLVRPFATKHRAAREWLPDASTFERRPASATELRREVWALDPRRAPRPLPAAPFGSAWVARRELLETHGFYDACIVGGGDLAMLFAACGFAEVTCDIHGLNPRRREHYLAWAGPFGADVGGTVGHLHGTVHNLWHGAPEHRRYAERHRMFGAHDFDPYLDVEQGPGGCWQWSSDKPAMHAFVRTYMASRREDG